MSGFDQSFGRKKQENECSKNNRRATSMKKWIIAITLIACGNIQHAFYSPTLKDPTITKAVISSANSDSPDRRVELQSHAIQPSLKSGEGIYESRIQWEEHVLNIARAFRSYSLTDEAANITSSTAGWCVQVGSGSNQSDEAVTPFYKTIPNSLNRGLQHGGHQTGLIYVKLPKAASSTGAGVAMRIARHVGARKFHQDWMGRTTYRRENVKSTTSASGSSMKLMSPNLELACEHRWGHGELYRRTIHKPSLLWTMIRQPSSRALSEFFHFVVTRRGEEPTSANIMKFLISQKSRQVHYLESKEQLAERRKFGEGRNLPRMRRSDKIDYMVSKVKTILNNFDFIALVERMDESLVVMKILYELEHSDLIVLSAKRSGGYDDGKNLRQMAANASAPRCRKLVKSFTTREVDSYLENNFAVDNMDYLLYDVVNRSLDLTIDALGKDRVEVELKKRRRLQQLAEDRCLEKAIFPCSSNGVFQGVQSKENCYWSDAGCGYRCVDRVLSEDESREKDANSMKAALAETLNGK